MIQNKLYEKVLLKKYVRILRLFLYPIAAWPGQLFGEKMPLLLKFVKYFLPLLCVIQIMAQFYFAVFYFGNINSFLFGDVCLTLCLTVLTTFRCCLPMFKTYEKVLEDFIKKYHLIYFRDKQGFNSQVYQAVEKASDYFTKFMIAMMFIGIILFNLVPITNSYKKGVFTKDYNENITSEFSVYWKYPGYDQQEKPFLITTLINFEMSFACSFSVIAIDLLLVLMIFQIIGHIKILEFNLINLSIAGLEASRGEATKSQIIVGNIKFESDVDMYINRKLKSCIQHHCLIISFADNISSFFGSMLALNYLFDLFACCLSLFECFQGDSGALARFGTLTIMIFGQLIQTSVIFEYVSTASENLSSAVYSVPWERMGSDNRRLISIMLMRMQTPIEVTAMGMTKVGVQTMASILKTTFSYFTFLRSKSH